MAKTINTAKIPATLPKRVKFITSHVDKPGYPAAFCIVGEPRTVYLLVRPGCKNKDGAALR